MWDDVKFQMNPCWLTCFVFIGVCYDVTVLMYASFHQLVVNLRIKVGCLCKLMGQICIFNEGAADKLSHRLI